MKNITAIYDFLSDVISDSFIIFDFTQNRIDYISQNGLLSCCSEGKVLDYNSFKEIIYSADRFFLERVCENIQESIDNDILSIAKVDYFSFLLRICTDLFTHGQSDYFMTYVKLKPLLEKGRLRYGICLFSASIIREQDNQLFVYYKDMDYSTYSFKPKRWTYHSFSPLNKRQKEVLIWAQQGLSLKETAVKMNVVDKTVESIRTSLFEKLGVSSIEQAIQYALNRRLIY